MLARGRTLRRVLGPLCGLTAGLSWGVADFFAARGARSLPPAATAFVVKALGTAAFAVAVLAVSPGVLDLAVVPPAEAAGAGVLMTCGMLWFYRALSCGPVSIVSPVSSAYPLVTAAVSVAVLGAPLSARDGAGIAAVVAGVALSSGVTATGPAERGLRPAVAAALAWGVGAAVIARAVQTAGWQSATLVELVAGTLTFAAIPGATRPGRAVLASRAVWLAAVAQQGGESVFNLGLAHGGSPAVVSALSACYPAVTVLLALRGFGERLRPGALSGAVLTIGGVAMLTA